MVPLLIIGFWRQKLQEIFKIFYDAGSVLNRSIKTGAYSDGWVGCGELS
jgi:hypothetical protein